MPSTLRLWDLPVRLTHWSLVLLFATSWITAEQGWRQVHRVSGYTLLALVLFRIYWGFFGNHTARFHTFVRGPAEIVRYLRGVAAPHVGHNPLGGWSVMAMLVALLSQTILGLFAVDVDGIGSGPLAAYVSFEVGRGAAHWHHRVFDVLLLLVVLHLIAIFGYLLVKRENLILPMLTGLKGLRSASHPQPHFVSSRRAWLGLLLAAFLVATLTIL